MTLGTRIFTWLRGAPVGTDQDGNRYYREKGQRKLQRGGGRQSREKRWVIYNGAPEASKVPAMWHAWLHHTIDTVPAPDGGKRYGWEKAHEPNLSGTPGAYRPRGSVLRGGHRAGTTGDYEAWQPDA